MRIAIVNHCHPETAHVCATRAREFGAALARRGHAVLLLTATLPGDAGTEPEALFEDHDWTHPLWFPVQPDGAPLLQAQRSGRLPRPVSRALVAAMYLATGGVFPDWRRAAERQLPGIARLFRPDMVWGIFGNSDCWSIARTLARLADCPWTADVKDPWQTFIPAPFRSLLARRFTGFRTMTALSAGHAKDAALCFGIEPDVIYSGIPPEMATRPANPSSGSLLLSGGLYAESDAVVLVEGIRRHLVAGSVRRTVIYAGGDADRAAQILAPLQPVAELRIEPFLSFSDFTRMLREAAVNLYVRNPAALFQHKLFEVLAAGRPAVSCPAESSEAQELAARCGGMLLGGASPDEVARAIGQALGHGPAPPIPAELARFTWDAQAERLEQIFARAA